MPSSHINPSQDLDFQSLQRIKDEELRPNYDLNGLKLLREKAKNEKTLRELHRTDRHWGRAPYELLQNADDARAARALFILTAEGLAFLHDGRWFSNNNFRNLADGWSDKDPRECIGHKGLGFRSVLDITPSPYVFRLATNDFFGFRFSWATNNGHIQESLNRDPQLRSYVAQWTAQWQDICPIMAIPSLLTRAPAGSAQRIFGACTSGRFDGLSLTTLFWFPAKDPDIPPEVLRDLGPTPIVSSEENRNHLSEFLSSEIATLMPFLPNIKCVEAYDDFHLLSRVTRFIQTERQITEQEAGAEVTISIEQSGIQGTRAKKYFAMYRLIDIPGRITESNQTPKAVRAMKQASLAFAVQVDDAPRPNQDAMFHVYFPTQEPTGTGFSIHGDFFVKPDRTRLMPGQYNQWLWETAGTLCANDFLDSLLDRYRPLSVYETMAPNGNRNTEAARYFLASFSKALKTRSKPFLVSNAGMVKQSEAVLPPHIDQAGFWDRHFHKAVSTHLRGKTFVRSQEDTSLSRCFFDLAGVFVLSEPAFLDLMEIAGNSELNPKWWYDCYQYLYKSSHFVHQDHAFFQGRRILLADEGPIQVPNNTEIVVSLPPRDENEQLSLPRLFLNTFVFIRRNLAAYIESGSVDVEQWIMRALGVVRFEATDLIPKAIRKVAPKLFSGQTSLTVNELAEAWRFIFTASRAIESHDFWREVGRFPLPVERSGRSPALGKEELRPAFLCYFPDSFLDADSPLLAVPALTRVDDSFLQAMMTGTDISKSELLALLARAGISGGPKMLKFSRLVDDTQVTLDSFGRVPVRPLRFSGERQADENVAVMNLIAGTSLWDSPPSEFCAHQFPKILQSLTILEGISRCVELAVEQFNVRNAEWKPRLWSLIRYLPEIAFDSQSDRIFCRGGGVTGHTISIETQMSRQLTKLPCFPSSLGPVNRQTVFARRSSLKLIRSRAASDELGDLLLPYVVSDNFADLEKLRRLGVEFLDDANSATPEGLARALRFLGLRLSSEKGEKDFVCQPARWRLIRGAIQEIYRALNKAETIPDLSGVKLAVRTPDGIRLKDPPFYYADPGSAIERGFLRHLNLIDVDRPFAKLFDSLNVIRLNPGETVDEELLDLSKAHESNELKHDIVEKLGPYLLALILVEANRAEVERVVRRLKERFQVFILPRLEVHLSLRSSPSVSSQVNFSHAYLQRRLLHGHGAIEEAHFKLFVSSEGGTNLFSIDGDALGATLTPVFADVLDDDYAGYFSRIIVRYQHSGGDLSSMTRFLLEHLSIPKETQEEARDILLGTAQHELALPPPRAILIESSLTTSDEAHQHVQSASTFNSHEQDLVQQTKAFLNDLATPTREPDHEDHLSFTDDAPSHPLSVTTIRSASITEEQKHRGLLGEEEIKRRLLLPGGWEGFVLIEDHRTPPRGYDFLCSREGCSVRLEIKTFTRHGRVIVTSGELREAANDGTSYYLVAVLDNGLAPESWDTFILRNPIDNLLHLGTFRTDPELHVPSEALIDAIMRTI